MADPFGHANGQRARPASGSLVALAESGFAGRFMESRGARPNNCQFVCCVPFAGARLRNSRISEWALVARMTKLGGVIIVRRRPLNWTAPVQV